MATQHTRGLTYDDLRGFPEDNFRRELVDGELIVTASPSTRHQETVLELGARLLAWTKEHGGKVFVAPTDVFFSETNVVEPDVLFVRQEHGERVEKQFVRSAPDVVIEVSSPSTRRFELVRKRELYERFGVPEYWYVDLESDRVEIYRLGSSGYDRPIVLSRDDTLESPLIRSFGFDVEDLLGRREESPPR
jgi:Uma2 family endonuclease